VTNSDGEQPKIPERYAMRYEQLVNTPVLDRVPYFHDEEIEHILEVARLEAEKRELEARLQRISDWCEAYPLDVFTEPDMEQVRKLLGDTLLTQLSAHNFRHVLDGIKGCANCHCGSMHTEGKKPI
jgi:hypothetical protein